MHSSFLKKLEELRNLLEKSFPDEDMRNIKMMSKIAHYHYNKKRFMLLGTERKLYNFLVENSYNPYTVYRWMLLEKLPEDIKFQIKQNQISQKNAISKAFQRNHETSSGLALSVKEYGLNLIKRM
tara:strand:+ start:10670 stop:11044 length:375 start_codon:yes stop_codon:yes gene_type:complete